MFLEEQNLLYHQCCTGLHILYIFLYVPTKGAALKTCKHL